MWSISCRAKSCLDLIKYMKIMKPLDFTSLTLTVKDHLEWMKMKLLLQILSMIRISKIRVPNLRISLASLNQDLTMILWTRQNIKLKMTWLRKPLRPITVQIKLLSELWIEASKIWKSSNNGAPPSSQLMNHSMRNGRNISNMWTIRSIKVWASNEMILKQRKVAPLKYQDKRKNPLKILNKRETSIVKLTRTIRVQSTRKSIRNQRDMIKITKSPLPNRS